MCSFKLSFEISKLGLSFFIKLTAFFITVKVFNPSKSNLTRPASSDDFISNWVTGIGILEDKSLYKGTIFLNPCLQ